MQNEKSKGRYSYSKISCYEQCPYKYNLRYNEQKYISEAGVAAAYGSLVHHILQREADAIKAGKEIDYEELKTDFVELNLPKRSKWDRDGDLFGTKILSKRYPKEWLDFDTKSGKNYAAKAQEFLSSGIYEFPKFMSEHPELEVYGAEVQFEFEYRGYVFYGFIDRILRERGTDRYLIYDIKTKDSLFRDQDLVTPLQFVIYAKALREKIGGDIEISCFYDLPTIHTTQAAGTKGFEARGMKKVDKLLDGVEAGDYHPKPQALCFYCDFSNFNPKQPAAGKNLCPYYSFWSPDDKQNHNVKFEWKGQEKHEEVMKKFLEQERQEEGLNRDAMRGTFDFDF